MDLFFELRSRASRLRSSSLIDLFTSSCSSECQNSREKALCSFPEANLSLSTGERVSIRTKYFYLSISFRSVFSSSLRDFAASF